MLPEVEAYFNTHDDYSAYRDELRRVDQDYPVLAWDITLSPDERAAQYQADTDRHTAIRKVEHDRQEKLAKRLDGLRNSENPLVRWIATNKEIQSEYKEHGEAILKALPLSRSELEDFRYGRDWCDTYDRFLALADKAGVLPPAENDVANIDSLTQEILNAYNNGSRRFRRSSVQQMIRKHLPGIIESAKEREAANQA